MLTYQVSFYNIQKRLDEITQISSDLIKILDLNSNLDTKLLNYEIFPSFEF
jgi:hypothetical protein